MLSDCCHVCHVMSCLSVCNVGALCPNGWMDQDETSHGVIGPRPGPHCVRGGPSSRPPKGRGGGAKPPIFGPYLLWTNCCMDQDATWYGGRTRPRRLCQMGTPLPLPKKGAEPSPQFSAHIYCGHTAGWIKMALGMKVGLSPAR